MRSTVLVLPVLLALLSGGCLVEYVLPDASTTAVTTTGDLLPTGDATVVTAVTDATDATDATAAATAATTESSGGDTSGDGEACAQGLMRCDDVCVDLRADDSHCGECLEVCNVGERCVASQCRDVVPVDCTACPCEACPPGDGLLASTTGEGNDGGGDGGDGGGDPQQYLCCAPPEGEKALCIVGDLDEVLVCPGA